MNRENETSVKYHHVILDESNIAEFMDLLPDYPEKKPDKDVIAIGVKKDDEPCGMMVLRKDPAERTMAVEYIFVSEKYRLNGIGKKLIDAAKSTAESGGFKRLEMKYTFGLSALSDEFLIKTGFLENRIVGITYELSRSALGNYLKNDSDAAFMKEKFLQENAQKDIRSLSELSDREKTELSELHPLEELSSVAMDGERIEAYIIISKYENMFFMSGIHSDQASVDLLAGLLFRSAGLVYLNMREDETLVFTGYRQAYRKLISYLFDPVLEYGIKRTVIMQAEIRLKKE